MPTQTAKKRVHEIMSRDVVAVQPGDTIHEALDLMVENRVAALPVVDARQHVVGIVSTTDLIDATRDLDGELSELENADTMARVWIVESLRGRLGEETVDGMMCEFVATVTPDSTLAKAAAEMLSNRVHRLPVVDAKDRLIGIVSTMDILAEFARSESSNN